MRRDDEIERADDWHPFGRIVEMEGGGFYLTRKGYMAMTERQHPVVAYLRAYCAELRRHRAPDDPAAVHPRRRRAGSNDERCRHDRL
jgi:hypothetical protein